MIRDQVIVWAICTFLALLGGALLQLARTGVKSLRHIEDMLKTIGKTDDPLSILGRLYRLEAEYDQIRELMLKEGYDRRAQDRRTTGE